MIWFLERNDALLVCEIRKTGDQSTYEFEIAAPQGPTTHRFASPQALIAKYLSEQSRLMAEGWRPRAGNVASLD